MTKRKERAAEEEEEGVGGEGGGEHTKHLSWSEGEKKRVWKTEREKSQNNNKKKIGL